MDLILPALIGLMVAHAAFGNGHLAENLAIISRYRPMHFVKNMPVIGVVLCVAYVLITYMPFGDFNPLLWIFSKIFGSSASSNGNIIFAGLSWKWYALLFLPVLAIALPRLAKLEEEDYRAGTRDWSDGIRRSLRFGLAHLIMLIPFGAALALSIGGLWFTHHYFKGGVARSTVYHATYNTMLVVVIFASIFIE